LRRDSNRIPAALFIAILSSLYEPRKPNCLRGHYLMYRVNCIMEVTIIADPPAEAIPHSGLWAPELVSGKTRTIPQRVLKNV
jgi:hypothetical protein